MIKRKTATKATKKDQHKKKATSKQNAEDLFAKQLEKADFANFVREHLGIEGRRFRFDFADLRNMVAVEIQGGVFLYAGHSTGTGITKDCEKLALANINGWHVFQFTSGQVRSGKALEWLTEYYDRLYSGEYK